MTQIEEFSQRPSTAVEIGQQLVHAVGLAELEQQVEELGIVTYDQYHAMLVAANSRVIHHGVPLSDSYLPDRLPPNTAEGTLQAVAARVPISGRLADIYIGKDFTQEGDPIKQVPIHIVDLDMADGKFTQQAITIECAAINESDPDKDSSIEFEYDTAKGIYGIFHWNAVTREYELVSVITDNRERCDMPIFCNQQPGVGVGVKLGFAKEFIYKEATEVIEDGGIFKNRKGDIETTRDRAYKPESLGDIDYALLLKGMHLTEKLKREGRFPNASEANLAHLYPYDEQEDSNYLTRTLTHLLDHFPAFRYDYDKYEADIAKNITNKGEISRNSLLMRAAERLEEEFGKSVQTKMRIIHSYASQRWMQKVLNNVAGGWQLLGTMGVLDLDDKSQSMHTYIKDVYGMDVSDPEVTAALGGSFYFRTHQSPFPISTRLNNINLGDPNRINDYLVPSAWDIPHVEFTTKDELVAELMDREHFYKHSRLAGVLGETTIPTPGQHERIKIVDLRRAPGILLRWVIEHYDPNMDYILHEPTSRKATLSAMATGDFHVSIGKDTPMHRLNNSRLRVGVIAMNDMTGEYELQDVLVEGEAGSIHQTSPSPAHEVDITWVRDDVAITNDPIDNQAILAASTETGNRRERRRSKVSGSAGQLAMRGNGSALQTHLPVIPKLHSAEGREMEPTVTLWIDTEDGRAHLNQHRTNDPNHKWPPPFTIMRAPDRHLRNSYGRNHSKRRRK